MFRFIIIALSLVTAIVFATPRIMDIYDQRFQQVRVRQMSQELNMQTEPVIFPTDTMPSIVDDDDDDDDDEEGTIEAAEEEGLVAPADIQPMMPDASPIERLVAAEAIVREQTADPQTKGSAYLELGSRYVEDGEHEKAEISFERALENLETLPDSPEVRAQKAQIYLERAKVHREEGNEDEWREDVQEACVLQPSIVPECDDTD